MPETLQTFGDFSGYVLTQQRRIRKPEDALTLGQDNAPTVQALVLTKGAAVIELVVDADNPPYDSQKLFFAGKTLIAAFAAVGAQVTLGDRTAPLPASGAAGSTGPYLRALTLVPGTPVPPGRGAIIKGAGGFVLKLQGGGTVTLSDATGGAGTKFDNLAVVDATVPTGGTVSVLY